MTDAADQPRDERGATGSGQPTRELLRAWHAGDAAALDTLVRQEAGWITAHVHRRLGPQLRARSDTQDLVQHTLLEVLKTGPRFVLDDREQLRALLATMVENVLRWHARHDQQQKRDVRREVPLLPKASATVLELGPPAAGPGPGTAAATSETRDWVRLALELLDPDDRSVLVWREYDELPFAEIGARLGITEAHARVRFQRALPKLARKLQQLQAGRLADALPPSNE
ncbi:MAG: sigma-70 family RNA polymerase sigma factor [Planctomycetes bacterium]|nr:sigma-70 family RNA polymerase sigma factor [Planctomycetota bacterium]